ncbi:hypothetical protein U1701_00050 [Sphingomonas sp. PB2P19]|uniref:hypothetical protein n=1 Tax=Sphingomonas rhamnosi TaxID=3096156 RepID=UPI002FCA4569
MKQYEHNELHDRVIFSARDVVSIRPELAALNNTHPTFVSIRRAFEAETVNISAKQAEVLNRSLAAENKPYLCDIVARNPFASSTSFKGSTQAALRSVMSHLECGTYGDWTHTDDFLALPKGMSVLEVYAGDGILYLAFENARDLDTATIALDTPVWMI